jgi:uncharacterized RDD family membrane protein YckC
LPGKARRGDRQIEARDVALGVVVVCGHVSAAAGRLALLPLRVAVRFPVVGTVLGRTGESLAREGREARDRGLDQVGAAAGEVLGSPEVGRAVDRALAGPLPENVARSIVERQVARRIVEQVVGSVDVQAAVDAAFEHAATEHLVQATLASPGFERIASGTAESLLASKATEQVLESAEMQRVVEEIASSPAVRAALFHQTTTLADEVSAGLRRQMERLDDAAERRVHRWLPGRAQPETSARVAPSRYGGLGARGTAFAVDLVVGTLAFLAAAGLGALVAWLGPGLAPSLLAEVLASAGWLIVVGIYLALFWTVTGQTPGMRLMHLRVVDQRGSPPRFWRSSIRLIGLLLAIVPLFAGFLPVLFDRRRRALQDFMAGTLVEAEHHAPAHGGEPSVVEPASREVLLSADESPNVPVHPK